VTDTHENDYRALLWRTLITIGICIVAVLICYFWIDRSVAFFVYHHHVNKIEAFRWLTYPPPEVQNWSALVLTVLMVRRACGPFPHWQKVLLVACVSLIVADDFRISLGDVFGRYWPDTWTTTILRSSELARTVSIHFSAATTSAVFPLDTPAESWPSPWYG
jgi:hypothetical protein